MLEELLKDIEQLNLINNKEMLFNLYEDEDAYTIEVVFDNQLIISREDKRYILEDSTIDFENVLKNVGKRLKSYFKENKTKYKNFKSIAYGFVDGDLYYIKKPRKKKQQIHYTKEDFLDFDDAKLKAWLTVYLNDKAKKIYEKELLEMAIHFTGFSKEEKEKWCEILAQYFDYQKLRELN